MRSAELPSLLLDQHFSDVDEFADGVDWGFDFRQLDTGALNAHIALRGTSNVAFMRFELNRSFHQLGQAPSDMLTFGLPEREVGEFGFCRKAVRGGNLLNFNLASGFEGVTQAGFAGFTISFRKTFLEEVSEVLGLTVDRCINVGAAEAWRDVDHLTGQLRLRLAAAVHATSNANRLETIELFESSVAEMVLEILSSQQAAESGGPICFRNRALRETMEWIEETEELPMTVLELCKDVGYSSPTLYRAFMEEFGVGPKRYLHVKRLSRVRHDLIFRSAGTGISDIANRWGFWHMGKFAADYKMQFGELPSQTRLNC